MSQKRPLLTEAVVNLLQEQLDDSFNLFLQDVDLEYDDGISLEPLQKVYISKSYETLELPAAYILFSDHAFQYTEDPNYLDSEDSAVVVVTCADVDGQDVVRKAFRYGRVLHACFNNMQLQSDDGRVQLVTVIQRLGYTDEVIGNMNKEEKRFRKDVVLELKIKHYENNLKD